MELRSYLGEDCQAELMSVSSQVKEASSKARSAGVEIVYPNQDRLDGLMGTLKDFTPEQIKEAVSSRSGEAYPLLSERASIAGANHQNSLEIAKLAIVLSKMDEVEGKRLAKAVRSGSFEEPLKVGSLKEGERQKLSRFLCRLGIVCSLDGAELLPLKPAQSEVPMTVENKRVWVDQETSKRLEDNLKSMEQLGSELQVRNAKRHIMDFSEEEEKRYTSLQAEYLGLLKEQDKLLSGYAGELQ